MYFFFGIKKTQEKKKIRRGNVQDNLVCPEGYPVKVRQNNDFFFTPEKVSRYVRPKEPINQTCIINKKIMIELSQKT